MVHEKPAEGFATAAERPASLDDRPDRLRAAVVAALRRRATAQAYANDDGDHLMISLVADRIADDFERAQEPAFTRERFLEATRCSFN